MSMHSKPIGWLFWVLVLCCDTLCADLNCLVFKVGQGNFVLLTHLDKALVVDCGVGAGYAHMFSNIHTPYSAEINNRMAGVNYLKIIVTHNHKDHYSSINTLKNLIASINSQMENKQPIDIEECQYAQNSAKVPVEGFLTGALGDDVRFDVIAPEDFNNTFLNPEDEHQRNLVLIVHFTNKSIVLPGDAGGSLFSYHFMHTQDLIEKLSNS